MNCLNIKKTVIFQTFTGSMLETPDVEGGRKGQAGKRLKSSKHKMEKSKFKYVGDKRLS